MSTLEIGWSSSLLMLWQMSAHILHNCHSSKSLQRVLGADLRSGHRCFFILKDYFFLALHYSLCSVHWASVSFIFESCHKHCEISCLYWPFQTLYRICRFHPFYLFCHKSLKLYVPILQLVNHCVSGTKRLTPHILEISFFMLIYTVSDDGCLIQESEVHLAFLYSKQHKHNLT